jgi:hypothetical protein
VATCAAKTTAVISNCLLALFLLAMVKRQRVLGCFFLALASYQGRDSSNSY